MSKKKSSKRIWLLALVPVILLVLGILFVNVSDFAVLDAKGEIAQKERNILIITTLLGLLVVVPVFILTYAIAWRYREGNSKKVKYSPDMDGNFFAEIIWWAIPCAIIVALAIITWHSSHALDPTKKLVSATKPMTIQVVALQWRWLFIYPEEGIASLNYVEFPANTPINFEITSDAPMNSFWIPRLGGQIYAMAGMTTHLHLMANEPGVFRGSSANISGDGFAGMTFAAQSVSQADFKSWSNSASYSDNVLSTDEYLKISKPSKDKTLTSYALNEPDLYDRIVMKYMMPGQQLRKDNY